MPRLTRDRTTRLAYAQLGLWGFFLYGFGPVVPLLRDEQGTSAAVAGLHSTAIAAGSMVGGALFAPLARRIGRGPAIWTGLAAVAVLVAAFGLLRPLPATLAVVALISAAGMLVVAGVAVVLTARHGPTAPAALTEANAACAGMGILAPLVIGAGVDAGLGWRPVMAVEVGLIAVVALAARLSRVRPPHGAPAAAAPATPLGPPAPDAVLGEPVTPSGRTGVAAGPVDQWGPGVEVSGAGARSGPGVEVSAAGARSGLGVEVLGAGARSGPVSGISGGDGLPGRAAGVSGPPARPGPVAVVPAAAGRVAERLPRAYWIAWVLMSVTGSIEVCLSLWTADVLRTHAGMSAGGASAAVAAIVCGMFVGRLVGGRFALRWPPAPLLLGALTLSFAGFAIFWLATVGWLAVTGLVVLGLGNALHYPLAISIAVAVAGPAADKAAGWSAYSMGLGFGIAPVALGAVADGIGPHLAFLLLPGFIAAALALTVRLGRALRAPAA